MTHRMAVQLPPSKVVQVVFIGLFLAFYVVFVPLEYIPAIPTNASCVINICFILFTQKRVPATNKLRLSHWSGQINPQISMFINDDILKIQIS